ncbi:MAG TPA: hypothetical protein DER09_02420 [Prolixibacteraceae bacterium]|nr:hypothetical protein [Prolixibacteraceae bacterium]
MFFQQPKKKCFVFAGFDYLIVVIVDENIVILIIPGEAIPNVLRFKSSRFKREDFLKNLI